MHINHNSIFQFNNEPLTISLSRTMVGIFEFQFRNVKDSLIFFSKIYDKYIIFAKYVEIILK
jgi:hypothetical protein